MKHIFLALLSFALTACTTFFSERVVCPKTAILAEFSKTINIVNNIPVRSELDSLLPYCTKEGQQKIIDFRLRITSFRHHTKSQVSLALKPSYFVAVVDNSGCILSRTNHDLEVFFEENQTTKVIFEHLQETVPRDKNVTIYVGFNLDEDQVQLLHTERKKKLQNQSFKPH